MKKSLVILFLMCFCTFHHFCLGQIFLKTEIAIKGELSESCRVCGAQITKMQDGYFQYVYDCSNIDLFGICRAFCCENVAIFFSWVNEGKRKINRRIGNLSDVLMDNRELFGYLKERMAVNLSAAEKKRIRKYSLSLMHGWEII